MPLERLLEPFATVRGTWAKRRAECPAADRAQRQAIERDFDRSRRRHGASLIDQRRQKSADGESFRRLPVFYRNRSTRGFASHKFVREPLLDDACRRQSGDLRRRPLSAVCADPNRPATSRRRPPLAWPTVCRPSTIRRAARGPCSQSQARRFCRIAFGAAGGAPSDASQLLAAAGHEAGRIDFQVALPMRNHARAGVLDLVPHRDVHRIVALVARSVAISADRALDHVVVDRDRDRIGRGERDRPRSASSSSSILGGSSPRKSMASSFGVMTRDAARPPRSPPERCSPATRERERPGPARPPTAAAAVCAPKRGPPVCKAFRRSSSSVVLKPNTGGN